MKKITTLTLVLLFACFAIAQEASKGIAFEKEGTLFRQAVQKAMSQQKLIFLDCYTSWCGPCKMMANQIFPQEEVGNFMNPKYVSIKIDMEKGEGPELAKKFQVSAYPTMIVFNSRGQEIGRFVGGSREAGQFIERVKKASIDTGVAEMDKRFEAGERDEAFLYEYLNTLKAAYKRDQCNTVAEALLDGKAETFTEDPKLVEVFMGNLTNPFHPAFVTTAKNPEKLAAAVDKVRKGAAQMKIMSVWRNYPRELMTEANGTATLDEANMNKWLDLMKECKVDKNIREDLRLNLLMKYYEKKPDWNAYVECIKEYGKNMDIPDLMLSKWATPVVKDCKEEAPRKAMKEILQKRVSDLESGKRAPQTQQGAMKLSGNMSQVMQMLINSIDGKETMLNK